MTEPEHKGTKQFLNAVSERFSKLNPAETSDLTQAYEVLDGYLRISEDHEDFDEPKAYLKSEKVGRLKPAALQSLSCLVDDEHSQLATDRREAVLSAINRLTRGRASFEHFRPPTDHEIKFAKEEARRQGMEETVILAREGVPSDASVHSRWMVVGTFVQVYKGLVDNY